MARSISSARHQTALASIFVEASTPTSPPDLVARLSSSVAQRPDVIAVEADDLTLTYAELDRLSTRLARTLCERLRREDGEQPRIGVSLSRGAIELVTLLAVLKAGAAYVPLDPTHPLERLGLVLGGAAPHALVVGPRSQLVPPSPACEVIELHGPASLDALASGTAPLPEPEPDALAYVMFTSGSTGRPKGVEVTRGALANFLRSMAHTPGLSPSDRLLAVTTTAFDIAGLELYLPLWVGATVIIADGQTSRDPRLLRQRLERGDVTVMQATPATWRLLLDAGYGGQARPLRMLCGGEALPAALADRLLATGGELWNMYGPTETTIWSSLERIEAGYDRITIGRPIDATEMVVLDEALRPVPAGQQGELAIGGAGLARGYRGQPELTAERFVDHPGLGTRLYRTGDLCRQLPDGRFEWCARLDHQVKIHGFRVELGEIEARLGTVAGVSSVVVVAHPRQGADPLLCAYWVGTAERADLVAAARRSLPTPVVPGAWIRLAELPLNPNGKVDRKALPPPEAGLFEVGEILARPRCDAEVRIARIFADVLRLPAVPIDRDFFTLGGTSVLATQVTLRLGAELGVEVPLAAVFEAPTVERLAERLRGELSGDAPIVVPLRPGSSGRPPLLCLLGVHVYQDLALALAGDRPVIGMHVPLRYRPDRESPPSLAAIAERYEALVRRHQPHGPYHLAGLCFGGVVAHEVARRLEATGERVASLTVVDAVLPSAVRTDRVARVRGAVGAVLRAWQDPQELRRRIERRGRRIAERLRGATRGATRGGGRPVELAIEGPAVEAAFRWFDAAASRIDARLLVVRAMGAPQPRWRHVARDLGWGGRARVVEVIDVAADHLGVVRAPHVDTLARAIDALGD